MYAAIEWTYRSAGVIDTDPALSIVCFFAGMGFQAFLSRVWARWQDRG